jgi:hypothetical protein
MLTSLLLWLKADPRGNRAGLRRRTAGLRLEALEERTVLSTLTVLNNSDHDPGSLRATIAAASSGDQIVFDPALDGQTITLTSGELLLDKDLTITGPGADQLTISGNNSSRIFEIDSSATDSLSGLTISNGRALDHGGGIANAGTLTLSHATVSGSVTYANPDPTGAGDYGAGIYNNGTLTVQNSSVSGNTALTVLGVGPIFGEGGGIFNVPVMVFQGGHYVARGGILTVTDSTISGNTAWGGGGGLCNRPVLAGSGTVTIRHSTISGNDARNDFSSGGGGILEFAAGLTVTDSTISSNQANSGGGILNDGTSLTVSNCTLDGNFADQQGGGISNPRGGTLTISNSTLTGNQAQQEGGGIYSYGTLTISSSTIAGNTTPGDGGGIEGIDTVNVQNTILAENASGGVGPDLNGTLASSGYNLIGDGWGGDGFADSDLVGTYDAVIDPLLGPLEDNGGPTQTMALLPGSPALNAGDPTQAGVADQRGVVRSGGVNIGAFQASAPSFVLTAPGTASSGVPFDLTVAVYDAFGQAAVGYTGTVHFSTSDTDPNVVLPPDYTFQISDGGSVTFPADVTLVTSGPQTVTATDLSTGITGSTGVVVL